MSVKPNQKLTLKEKIAENKRKKEEEEKKKQEALLNLQTEPEAQNQAPLIKEVENPLTSQTQTEQTSGELTDEAREKAEKKRIRMEKLKLKMKKKQQVFDPEKVKPEQKKKVSVSNKNPAPKYKVKAPQTYDEMKLQQQQQAQVLQMQQAYYQNYLAQQQMMQRSPMYNSQFNPNTGFMGNFQNPAYPNNFTSQSTRFVPNTKPSYNQGYKSSRNMMAPHKRSSKYESDLLQDNQSEHSEYVKKDNPDETNKVTEPAVQNINIEEPINEDKKVNAKEIMDMLSGTSKIDSKKNDKVPTAFKNEAKEEAKKESEPAKKPVEEEKKEEQPQQPEVVVEKKEAEPVVQEKEEIKPVTDPKRVVNKEPVVQEQEKPVEEVEEPRADQVQQKEGAIEESASLVYSHEFILNFINDYSEELPEEYKHLQRKVNEQDLPPPKYKKHHDGGRGRKHGKKNYGNRVDATKPSNNKYKDKYRRPEKHDEKTSEKLERQQVSEEYLIQMKQIKNAADTWMANKKDDDPTTVNFKKIKGLLNKLTADNFEKISNQIIELNDSEDILKKLIEFLVKKAWNEPMYTQLYAKLVNTLYKFKFAWDAKNKYKTVRSLVLGRVENAYTTGFDAYYQLTKKIHESKEMNEKEKFEQLFKNKKQLLGNINFICELFFFKILNFKLFKLIILYGVGMFTREYIRNETDADKFTIKEDYLEALIKFFENAGKQIEEAEEKDQKKNGITVGKTEDYLLDKLYAMIEDSEDNTDMFIEKDQLDKFKTMASVSFIFFEFLDMIFDKNISQRMRSLIENLREYRSSKWTTIIKGVVSAKSKKQVQQILEKEQEKKKEKSYRDFERYDYDGYDNYHKKKKNKNKGDRDNRNKSYKQLSSIRDYDDEDDGEYVAKETVTVMSLEETTKDLNAYFKEKNKSLTTDEFCAYMDKHKCKDSKTLLTAFLQIFAERRKDQVQLVQNVPVSLFEKGKIKKADFVEALYEANKKLYLMVSDLPFLQPALAHMFYQLYQQDFNLLEEMQWIVDEKKDNIEDIDEWIYYCKQFLDAIKKEFAKQGDEDEVADKIQQLKAEIKEMDN